jgi:hypothetical protein
LTGSSDDLRLLDLERDIPTTAEDVEALWRLAHRPVVTDPARANDLRDPFWTLERALAAPFFSDADESFEL